MSTPGPRRFLNPSSDRCKAPKLTRRKTGQSSQISSSLRQPSSTQFARTPHFTNPYKEDIDEVDVNFEHRTASTDTKVRRGVRRPSRSYDDLIDGNDDEDAALVQPSERPPVTNENDLFNNDTTRPSKYTDTIQDIDEDHFSQPTSKRLKISESARNRDTILISSSSSETSDHPNNSHDPAHHFTSEEYFNSNPPDAFTLDLSTGDLSSSPSPPSSPTQTRSTVPRFKAPPASSASTGAQQSSKRFLKPPFPPAPSQLAQGHAPLPDAFSPSRRRGRRAYVPGGAADTLRAWVLALAGAAEGGPGARFRQDPNAKRVVRVVELRSDVEGRCVVVVDEVGEEWLLVTTGQGLQGHVGGVAVGDVVEVTAGGGTSWRISLGEGGGAGETTGRNVNVSVLWKVKQ